MRVEDSGKSEGCSVMERIGEIPHSKEGKLPPMVFYGEKT
ncbi:MAG: hypothetical protein DDT32_01858 [Syntrophomonadaceae bacterium]|nr:hypothetical protein [Bacillota bacterium]MBT9148088.1 hypothetical protein [Bacillota bacterium]